MNRPPSPMKDWGIYLSNVWAWHFIPPVFPSSRSVRMADLDGWVEQGGYLLHVDGAVSPDLPRKPSRAVEIAMRAGNITWLGLQTVNPLNPDTHEPESIDAYRLLRGPWPAPDYEWNHWRRFGEYGHWETVALIAQWAAWAHYTTYGGGR